jgi:hypothetical protein
VMFADNEDVVPDLNQSSPARLPRTRRPAGSIARQGFLGGGEIFAGTDFGASPFLGFFFSFFCELLPFPMFVAPQIGCASLQKNKQSTASRAATVVI